MPLREDGVVLDLGAGLGITATSFIPPPHFSHLTGSTSKIFLRHADHDRFAALAAFRTSRTAFPAIVTE